MSSNRLNVGKNGFQLADILMSKAFLKNARKAQFSYKTALEDKRKQHDKKKGQKNVLGY